MNSVPGSLSSTLDALMSISVLNVKFYGVLWSTYHTSVICCLKKNIQRLVQALSALLIFSSKFKTVMFYLYSYIFFIINTLIKIFTTIIGIHDTAECCEKNCRPWIKGSWIFYTAAVDEDTHFIIKEENISHLKFLCAVCK